MKMASIHIGTTKHYTTNIKRNYIDLYFINKNCIDNKSKLTLLGDFLTLHPFSPIPNNMDEGDHASLNQTYLLGPLQ
jgi:hypothetical protein